MRRRGKGRGNDCPQEPRGGARLQSLLQPAPASRVGYQIPVPTNSIFVQAEDLRIRAASPLSLVLYIRWEQVNKLGIKSALDRLSLRFPYYRHPLLTTRTTAVPTLPPSLSYIWYVYAPA